MQPFNNNVSSCTHKNLKLRKKKSWLSLGLQCEEVRLCELHCLNHSIYELRFLIFLILAQKRKHKYDLTIKMNESWSKSTFAIFFITLLYYNIDIAPKQFSKEYQVAS